jgi:hypothetical protein
MLGVGTADSVFFLEIFFVPDDQVLVKFDLRRQPPAEMADIPHVFTGA